jgi:hypothetical protein
MRKIRDVLRLSAAGMSKRKIAASLGVSATAAGEWYPAGAACRPQLAAAGRPE